MSAEDDEPIKKDRDTILTVGFIVLVLAFATVSGVFINDNYLKSEGTVPAVIGETVNIDYVGSYYGFFDEDGAVIFDTSLWSYANNSDYLKSYDFSLKSESSYSPLSVEIRAGNYLQAFESAIIGLKAGESVTICIAPADGYGAITSNTISSVTSDDLKIKFTETLTTTEVKEKYGIDVTTNKTVRGPYGWDMEIRIVESNQSGAHKVTVTHNVIDGGIYLMNDDVNVLVDFIDSETFSITYVFKNGGIQTVESVDPQYVSDGSDPAVFIHPDTGEEYASVKLIKIFYNGSELYLFAVQFDDDGNVTEYLLRNSDERVGMYLYFTITRV